MRTLKFDLRARRLSDVEATSEVVYSSKPYPLSVVDSLDAPLTLASGRMFKAIYEHGDDIDASLTMGLGSLRLAQQTYGMQPESLDAPMTLASGELRSVLKAYAWSAEAVDSTLTLSGGSLAVKLISYPNWPAESLDTSLTLSSGSLT